MAHWHLTDIENALNRIGFQVIERKPAIADDYFIGGWTIKRSNTYTIDFDGIYDGMGMVIKNPSIEKAFGCSINNTSISLYFYKKGAKWKENLKRFVEEVNGLG